jgi:hypothetical protein
MPPVRIASKGLTPWISDKATWPLLSIIVSRSRRRNECRFYLRLAYFDGPRAPVCTVEFESSHLNTPPNSPTSDHPQAAGGVYVGYNIYRHLRFNPDVMVSREYRSTPAGEGKFDMRPVTATWVREHERKYPHVDQDTSRFHILDSLSPAAFAQRAQVRANPERYTRSGQTRSLD